MELDAVACPAEISGYFTTLVTLAELLAFGAKPVLVTDNLSFAMEPHGKEAIAGVHRALTEAGYPQCPVTGSTEENVPARQTAMGITILGVAPKEIRDQRVIRSGDVCYLIGLPLVGNQVMENLDEIKTLEYLPLFSRVEKIGDVLPVGSKGVRHEMMEMAKTHSMEWRMEDLDSSLLDRSAGPATCFLVAGEESVLKEVIKSYGMKALKVGTLLSARQ